jgi:hypothetical protein
MLTSFQRDLKKKSRHLVMVKRSPGMPTVFGFVVDSSPELVLLHSFDSEVFCLNGYDVIRQKDINTFCFFDNQRYWRFRALRRLQINPVKPAGISLASVPELLPSVIANYPLLSVHRESRTSRTTYVGPIVSRAEKSFMIEDTDCYGQWTGPRRMRYAEVTRVYFDGGFLKASAMTAPSVRRSK